MLIIIVTTQSLYLEYTNKSGFKVKQFKKIYDKTKTKQTKNETGIDWEIREALRKKLNPLHLSLPALFVKQRVFDQLYSSIKKVKTFQSNENFGNEKQSRVILHLN